MDQSEFHVLNAAGRLPSPKGVALQLMRLIRRKTVSIGDIAQTIKSDPALAGRVLAAANASVNHSGRRYLSVPEALTVVGTAVTYRLALGLSVISNTREGSCREFDYRRHWLHSAIVALVMQALAARTRVGPPEDAFTVGLMHRIGRLGLATLHPDEYGAILARNGDRAATRVAERAAFATDEIELGQYLLANWGFPDVFLEAMALVDRIAPEVGPEDSRVYRIARLLRVADESAECGIGRDFAPRAGSDPTALAAPLNLTSDDLREVWNDVAAAWPTWRQLLDLDGFELHRFDAVEPARDVLPYPPPDAAIASRNETDPECEHARHEATELGIANRRLQEVALTDSLTGLPNRRCADDHMEKEWAAAGSSGEPLSCLMIDVDHFKTFNDTFGHDVGDAVLAHLASVMRAHVRAHDTVCRVGGEEFLVVCRNTTRESAQVCAERLRAVVQATPLVVGGVCHAVTVSVGVAFADSVVPDPPALRTRADQALYCAKRQGRNRVAVL